ncbi:4187_t:CDS:2 [Diversispora eburnea]|uniref:4187_t:CDS:1 n=1 Tax=Diversispora eburnea TaxID=1213867 RepID=A0A9N9CAK6_9GLOM|nr:4187_t:CDS:2 [Diversispora eburnea]
MGSSTIFSNENNNYDNNNRPTSFGRNKIGEHGNNFNFIATTTINNANNKNLIKKVKFSNFIKISDVDSIDDYDRCGQLGQKEENYKIDVWFTEVGVALKNVNRKVERLRDNVEECRILDLTNGN